MDILKMQNNSKQSHAQKGTTVSHKKQHKKQKEPQTLKKNNNKCLKTKQILLLLVYLNQLAAIVISFWQKLTNNGVGGSSEINMLFSDIVSYILYIMINLMIIVANFYQMNYSNIKSKIDLLAEVDQNKVINQFAMVFFNYSPCQIINIRMLCFIFINQQLFPSIQEIIDDINFFSEIFANEDQQVKLAELMYYFQQKAIQYYMRVTYVFNVIVIILMIFVNFCLACNRLVQLTSAKRLKKKKEIQNKMMNHKLFASKNQQEQSNDEDDFSEVSDYNQNIQKTVDDNIQM